MKKTLLLICAMFFMLSLKSQQISSYVLVNKENHIKVTESAHNRMQSESDMGLSLQFTLDQLEIGDWPVGFGFGYHRFSGNFYIESGGNGGGVRTDMIYQKQLISLTVYPLCISHKNFRLRAGVEGTSLLDETVEGTEEVWSMHNGINTYPIEKDSRDLFKQYNIGLNINAGYNIRLYKGLGISPYVSMFIGSVSEVEHWEMKAHPVRFFGGLSFFWKTNN